MSETFRAAISTWTASLRARPRCTPERRRRSSTAFFIFRTTLHHVDDKLRILAAMKAGWHERITKVFPRQGHCALRPVNVAIYPAADVTLEASATFALRSFDSLCLVAVMRVARIGCFRSGTTQRELGNAPMDNPPMYRYSRSLRPCSSSIQEVIGKRAST